MNKFMEDIKKDKIKITTSMVLFLLLVIGATYAIIASFFNYDSSGVVTHIGSRPVFFADTSDQINLDIPYIPTTSDTEYVISADTASVNFSLSANYAANCSYDLYWIWDTGADGYIKTSGAEKEYTLSGLINNKEVFSEIQLNDYGINSNKTKLYTGMIVTEGATITYQTLIINAEFWKTKAMQEGHTNKNYSGKLSVENVVCQSGYGKNLSNSVLAQVSDEEYTSSQDSTVYKVIRETAKYAASNATYTKVTNYGTTSVYSASSSTAVSGDDASGVFTKSADNVWANVPANMTSGTYYHIVLPIQENGYYEICYNLGAGNRTLQSYVTDSVNTTSGDNIQLGGAYVLGSDSSKAQEGCYHIGYLTSDEAVRIVNRVVATENVSFYLQKTNNEESLDAGIRFVGKNPNNYVTFNGDEEWRIIGTFEGSTIGLEPGKQYTKIIRNEPIYKAWDEDSLGENDWVNSTLNAYLNGEYLHSLTSRKQIAKYNDNYSNWYLLGPTYGQSLSASSRAWYFYERTLGTAGYRDGVHSAADTVTSGAIGIMYPSDYGYAAYGEGCTSGTSLRDYNNGCGEVDWLMLSQKQEWLLSLRSGSPVTQYVVQGGAGGLVDSYTIDKEIALRPVVYLDYDVTYLSGDGSKEYPYMIFDGEYDTLSNTILSQESDLDYKSAQDGSIYKVAHETVKYNGTTYDAGVRYEGNDPDNYVTFNGNEEWRIIGVFEGSTIGLEPGKQYTKIIRSSSIGDKAWDE